MDIGSCLGTGGSRSVEISRLHVQASERCAIKSIKPFGHDALEAHSLPFSRGPGAQKQLTSETGLSCIQCALNRASFPLAQEEGGLHRAFPCRSHFARRSILSLPSHCARQPQPLCDADSSTSNHLSCRSSPGFCGQCPSLGTGYDHQSIHPCRVVRQGPTYHQHT